MGNTFYMQWEAQVILWLQHLGEGTVLQRLLIALNNVISACGEEIICILVFGAVYWGINKQIARKISVTLLLAQASNAMIKNVVCRLRPWQSVEEISLLRDVDGYSFPSGHSAGSAAVYPSLAYWFRDRWRKGVKIAVCILPLLVALSRCYLGAHWPTDVLAGLAEGLLFLVITELLYRNIRNEYIIYAICIILTIPGMFFCKTHDYFAVLGLTIGFMAGFCFEAHVVNFENTKHLGRIVLRIAGGLLLFIVGSVLLKALLGSLFAEDSAGFLAMYTLRYMIVAFLITGVYPLAFKREKKTI